MIWDWDNITFGNIKATALQVNGQGGSMLSDARFFSDPWDYFCCDQAFSAVEMQHFLDLLASATDWEQHSSSLYDGAMSDCTSEFDAGMAASLVGRMAELTGLRLTSQLQVNVQLMMPGEDVRPHSDRPLLGYELVRLVLQLNRDWPDEAGGFLHLHPDAAGETTVVRVAPEFNSAVGFVLNESCFHSVTRVTQPRNSAVFYFWHVANTEALKHHLQQLCLRLNFGALPALLNSIIAKAEGELSEERTLLAGTVAWILMEWGCEEDVVLLGYSDTAWPESAKTLDLWEGQVGASVDLLSVVLARWAGYLQVEVFDLTRWQALTESVAAVEKLGVSGKCLAFYKLAFPA